MPAKVSQPRCYRVTFEYETRGGKERGHSKAMPWAQAEIEAGKHRLFGRTARVEPIPHPHWDFWARGQCWKAQTERAK